jgi:hypothetical protein
MSVVTITSGNRTEITKYKYGTNGVRVSAEHEVWEGGELKSKTKTEYLNDSLNITGYSQVLKQTETDIVSGEKPLRQISSNINVSYKSLLKMVRSKNTILLSMVTDQREYYLTLPEQLLNSILLMRMVTQSVLIQPKH